MSEHTPGPWTLCGQHRGICKCGHVWGANGYVHIATVHHSDNAHRDDLEAQELWTDDLAIQKANARLIAAAPDLLTALQRLLTDYGDVPDPTDADGQAVMDEARAAIAKAGGDAGEEEEDQTVRKKPILCVDFDGVIHSYTSPWIDEETIPDSPVPGALRWLWKATEWFNVVVYSSRSKTEAGRTAMRAYMAVRSVEEFGPDHPMCGHQDPDIPYPIEFAHEKPAAFLTIDDRAICFEGDWNEFNPADLLDFKPWNKRPPLPKLGATKTFPDGSLGPHDEGGLNMGVAHDSRGLVHVNFGKDISWFAVPPAEAINLAKMLLHHAGVKKAELTL